MTATHTTFLNLEQVARQLDIHYCTAWSLVTRGELSALQIGRRWKVPQAAVDDFIRQGTEAAQQRAQRQQELRNQIGGTAWPSANVARRGGSTSRRQVDNELDSRLKQLTEKRRKNSTID